jgi:hypothetical protein
MRLGALTSLPHMEYDHLYFIYNGDNSFYSFFFVFFFTKKKKEKKARPKNFDII